MREAFERLPVATAVLEVDGVRGPVVVSASRSFRELVGASGDVVGMPLSEILELPDGAMTASGPIACRVPTAPDRALELHVAKLESGAVVQLPRAARQRKLGRYD